jgi:membrane protein YqaA with SNARE-associated domain
MALSREWLRFIYLFGVSLAACLMVFWFLPQHRNLILLYLYSIPSNSVVPIPHEPAMIFFGASHPPLVVALVAALATLVPCFLDYQAVTLVFQRRRLERIRKSDFYQGAIYYFLKAPFVAIAFAAFAPFIPFYVFRVLSPTSGYPLRRYMTAVTIGRLPRYYLFALMGSTFLLPDLAWIGGLILFVCIGLFLIVKRHLVSLRHPPASSHLGGENFPDNS